MAVQVNRRFDGRLQRFDQIIGIIWRQQAGHVFDANAVRSHLFKIFGLVDVIVDVVNLSAHSRLGHGIANAALEMFAVFFDYRHHGFKVAVIIEGIKCSEYVHPILTGSFNKGLGDIIGIVAIAHQVLSPQQHRKRCLFDVTLQGTNAFPGVFI